jgi:hypothetical protein
MSSIPQERVKNDGDVMKTCDSSNKFVVLEKLFQQSNPISSNLIRLPCLAGNVMSILPSTLNNKNYWIDNQPQKSSVHQAFRQKE